MDIRILGSGATHPIPKPCCECRICCESREEMSPPEMRTGPGLFIEDLNAVIDTSQDISFQLNRENVKTVESIFYTHFHPDHTIGMVLINQLAGSYKEDNGCVKVYFPSGVLKDLRKNNLSGMIDHYSEEGLAEVEKDFDSKDFGEVKIKAVELEEQNTYGFSLEDERKIFYAPCDITGFDLREVSGHGVFILEFGGLDMSEFDQPEEITDFHRVLEQLKQIDPEKVIFTHIEENRGLDHKELKDKAKELDKEAEFEIKIAYDGMKI